jgi:hypothetical protein
VQVDAGDHYTAELQRLTKVFTNFLKPRTLKNNCLVPVKKFPLTKVDKKIVGANSTIASKKKQYKLPIVKSFCIPTAYFSALYVKHQPITTQMPWGCIP